MEKRDFVDSISRKIDEANIENGNDTFQAFKEQVSDQVGLDIPDEWINIHTGEDFNKYKGASIYRAHSINPLASIDFGYIKTGVIFKKYHKIQLLGGIYRGASKRCLFQLYSNGAGLFSCSSEFDLEDILRDKKVRDILLKSLETLEPPKKKNFFKKFLRNLLKDLIVD